MHVANRQSPARYVRRAAPKESRARTSDAADEFGAQISAPYMTRAAGKNYRPGKCPFRARSGQCCACNLELSNTGQQVHCRHVDRGSIFADHRNGRLQRRISNKLAVEFVQRGDCRLKLSNSIIEVPRILFLEQAGVDGRPALVTAAKGVKAAVSNTREQVVGYSRAPISNLKRQAKCRLQ